MIIQIVIILIIIIIIIVVVLTIQQQDDFTKNYIKAPAHSRNPWHGKDPNPGFDTHTYAFLPFPTSRG